MRKVRIGIDVGGTFTDAVAIDDSTYQIIAQEKLPTTHDEAGGVATGIIRILQDLLLEIGDLLRTVSVGTHKIPNGIIQIINQQETTATAIVKEFSDTVSVGNWVTRLD